MTSRGTSSPSQMRALDGFCVHPIGVAFHLLPVGVIKGIELRVGIRGLSPGSSKRVAGRCWERKASGTGAYHISYVNLIR